MAINLDDIKLFFPRNCFYAVGSMGTHHFYFEFVISLYRSFWPLQYLRWRKIFFLIINLLFLAQMLFDLGIVSGQLFNKVNLPIKFTNLIQNYLLKFFHHQDNGMVWNLQTDFDFVKQLLAKLLCEHAAFSGVSGIHLSASKNSSQKWPPGLLGLKLVIEIVNSRHIGSRVEMLNTLKLV